VVQDQWDADHLFIQGLAVSIIAVLGKLFTMIGSKCHECSVEKSLFFQPGDEIAKRSIGV
jgi:hypothetical protein